MKERYEREPEKLSVYENCYLTGIVLRSYFQLGSNNKAPKPFYFQMNLRFWKFQNLTWAQLSFYFDSSLYCPDLSHHSTLSCLSPKTHLSLSLSWPIAHTQIIDSLIPLLNQPPVGSLLRSNYHYACSAHQPVCFAHTLPTTELPSLSPNHHMDAAPFGESHISPTVSSFYHKP